MPDFSDISLLPPGYGAATPAGGGGLFSGLLLGGGQQQNYGGLIGAASGGVSDQLINQLLQRQIEAATQPDFGGFAAALGRAAQPSLLPKSIGAALGEAAGALSGNKEQALARALQSAKLLQDLQLQRRKLDMAGKIIDPTSLQPLLDAITPPAGTPMVGGKPITPQGGIVPAKPLIPRVPLSDVATGDLSSSYGEVPGGEAAGGDSDLTAGGGTPPEPRPQSAGLTGSAREIADNNFGGLRRPGVYATPGQGGFQAFATPEQGVAAISRQLDRYASGATTGTPLTTVRQIVSTWAPPNENPTEALIARASRIVGADPDAPLDVSNPQVKARLIEATIANEQGGRVPVARELISRVAASNTPTASGGQMPPPRMPAESWLNQPVTSSGFRTPSDAPGNQGAAERLRQSILGTLAGGSPAGGLPPPDEVIRTGPPPAIPGLLKAQYSTVPGVDPSQSPAAALGGGAPAPPPVPGVLSGQPTAPMPTPPVPPGVDPRKMNALLLELARRNAAAEALGMGNPYGSMLSVLQGSPAYKAMIESAQRAAGLPFVGPEAEAKTTGERTAAYPFVVAEEQYKSALRMAEEQQKQLLQAGFTFQDIEVADGKGGTEKRRVNAQQMARITQGLDVPELGIPARIAPPSKEDSAGGTPRAGAVVGTPTGQAADVQKARLELDTLDAKTLREQATAGRKVLPLLGEVTRLAYEAPGGLTGKVSAELARMLPFPVPSGWTNAEVLASLGQQFLPSVRAPGAQSNAEMTAGLQAVPGLMQSQGGRVKIAAINRAMIERTVEMADIYREHLGTAELHRKLAELDKKPLFSDEIRREIGFGGQGNQPGGPTSTGGEIIQNGWRYDAKTHKPIGPVQ